MNMKRNFLALALMLAVAPAFADHSGDQGVGLMAGNPSGLSYKFWLDNNAALDAAFGVDQSELDVHATFLWHNYTWNSRIQDSLIKGITDNGEFPLYFGVGPRFLFSDNTEFGLRFPVGLSFLPNNTTWEFFSEIAPVVRFTPDTGMDFDFAVGARYYFPAVRARVAAN
jgi:hypothetical protein